MFQSLKKRSLSSSLGRPITATSRPKNDHSHRVCAAPPPPPVVHAISATSRPCNFSRLAAAVLLHTQCLAVTVIYSSILLGSALKFKTTTLIVCGPPQHRHQSSMQFLQISRRCTSTHTMPCRNSYLFFDSPW